MNSNTPSDPGSGPAFLEALRAIRPVNTGLRTVTRGKQPSFVVCLLFFMLVSIQPGIALPDDEIRSERSETIRQDSRVIRKMGIVDATFGTTEILADSAMVWIQEGRYLFMLGVNYGDSVRSVRADTLEFDDTGGLATFRGHVEAEEGGLNLSASQVRYRLAENDLLATGNARFEFEKEKIVLTAQLLQYKKVGDIGSASGATRMIAYPEPDSDSLFILADSLKFSDQGERIDFTSRVKLSLGQMNADAARAMYRGSEGRLGLKENPIVNWRNSAPAQDSVQIRGEEIYFSLDKGRIESIHILGRADIQMEIQKGESKEHRSIHADSSKIAIHRDRIASVQGWGSVKVDLADSSGSRATLSGDTLAMGFRNGKLDSLSIWGSFSGTHAASDTSSVNQLSGMRNRIWFQKGQIQRIQIAGEAACEHSPDHELEILITGDLVDLIFDQGDLQRVYADGGVDGYYTQDEGKTP